MRKILLISALLIFVCGYGQGEQLYADGTATDQDGNSFEWINYGTQDWAIENAKVVNYKDGTPIPEVTHSTQWFYSETGGFRRTAAWAHYANEPTFSRLYNWYAVMGIHDADPNTLNKKFAPEGWHVPSKAEWTTLENYLIANGYNFDGTTTGNKIAKAMASTLGWTADDNLGYPGYNQSTNNSSGFNAIPNGNRQTNGDFVNLSSKTGFWGSSEFSVSLGDLILIQRDYPSTVSYSVNKPLGLSVRFVKGIHPNDIDNDNDSYTENNGDCDDADGSVYPGAEDLIDGIDNNCDGVIDEQRNNISNLLTGASTNDDIGSSKTWYWQSDTDGFLGVGPPAIGDLYEIANPIWWSAPANEQARSCMYSNELVFNRVTNGVTFEQSGPVYLNGNYSGEFGITADNCYDESVVASIGGVKNVTFLASTSQAALQGSYGDTDFTKASMLFSDNGFMGHYAGHNLAQIEYEIIIITENELVVRFDDSDSELAWYSRFKTDNPMTIDDDGDGYTENQGDCDDTNASINPGATEIEDGIDNDCDGEID